MSEKGTSALMTVELDEERGAQVSPGKWPPPGMPGLAFLGNHSGVAGALRRQQRPSAFES